MEKKKKIATLSSSVILSSAMQDASYQALEPPPKPAHCAASQRRAEPQQVRSDRMVDEDKNKGNVR